MNEHINFEQMVGEISAIISRYHSSKVSSLGYDERLCHNIRTRIEFVGDDFIFDITSYDVQLGCKTAADRETWRLKNKLQP